MSKTNISNSPEEKILSNKLDAYENLNRNLNNEATTTTKSLLNTHNSHRSSSKTRLPLSSKGSTIQSSNYNNLCSPDKEQGLKKIKENDEDKYSKCNEKVINLLNSSNSAKKSINSGKKVIPHINIDYIEDNDNHNDYSHFMTEEHIQQQEKNLEKEEAENHFLNDHSNNDKKTDTSQLNLNVSTNISSSVNLFLKNFNSQTNQSTLSTKNSHNRNKSFHNLNLNNSMNVGNCKVTTPKNSTSKQKKNIFSSKKDLPSVLLNKELKEFKEKDNFGSSMNTTNSTNSTNTTSHTQTQPKSSRFGSNSLNNSIVKNQPNSQNLRNSSKSKISNFSQLENNDYNISSNTPIVKESKKISLETPNNIEFKRGIKRTSTHDKIASAIINSEPKTATFARRGSGINFSQFSTGILNSLHNAPSSFQQHKHIKSTSTYNNSQVIKLKSAEDENITHGVGANKFVEIFKKITKFLNFSKNNYSKINKEKGVDLFNDFEPINNEIVLIFNIFSKRKSQSILQDSNFSNILANISNSQSNLNILNDVSNFSNTESLIRNMDTLKFSSESRTNIYQNYFDICIESIKEIQFLVKSCDNINSKLLNSESTYPNYKLLHNKNMNGSSNLNISNSKIILPVVEHKDVNKLETRNNNSSKIRNHEKLDRSVRVEENKKNMKILEKNKKKLKETDQIINPQDKKKVKLVKKNSATLADIRDIIPKLKNGTPKKQKKSRKKVSNHESCSDDNLSDSMISEGVKIKIPQRSFQVNKPKDEEEMNYKVMTENTCGYISSDSNSSNTSKCDQESIFDFKRDLLELEDGVENLEMKGGSTRKLFAPKMKSKSLLNVNHKLKNNFFNILNEKENFENDILKPEKQIKRSLEDSGVSISKVKSYFFN